MHYFLLFYKASVSLYTYILPSVFFFLPRVSDIPLEITLSMVLVGDSQVLFVWILYFCPYTGFKILNWQYFSQHSGDNSYSQLPFPLLLFWGYYVVPFCLILYLLFLLCILQFFSDECCVSFFTFLLLRFVRLLESESWYLSWVLKIFQLFPFQILPSPLPSFGTLFVHVRCFHCILKVFSLFSISLSLIILFCKICLCQLSVSWVLF